MFKLIEEKTEKGIFFRSPIQRVEKETYSFGDGKDYAYYWLNTAKKYVIPYLLNCITYNSKKKFVEENDAAGIVVNELCWPIYFYRNVRRSYFRLENHPDGIKEIFSWGEEPYKNNCSGACMFEKTKIVFGNGDVKKIYRGSGSFHYTYAHVIEEEFL